VLLRVRLQSCPHLHVEVRQWGALENRVAGLLAIPTAELKLVVWSSILVVNETWRRSDSVVAQKEGPL